LVPIKANKKQIISSRKKDDTFGSAAAPWLQASLCFSPTASPLANQIGGFLSRQAPFSEPQMPLIMQLFAPLGF
jgi:hypothetical protein